MTPADYLVLALSAGFLAAFHGWLWLPRREAPKGSTHDA